VICDTCFWSAEITRRTGKIWCSHKDWNGWMAYPACKGSAWRNDERP
jgi:hypothetical protein